MKYLSIRLIISLGLLSVLNCMSARHFVDIQDTSGIEDLNEDIDGKKIRIYDPNGEFLTESDFVKVTQDSLYLMSSFSTAVSLQDISYLKIESKSSVLSVLPGLLLIGYGFYHASAPEAETFGEALGDTGEGLTMVTIGGVATLIGLLENKTHIYYFDKDIEIRPEQRLTAPCRTNSTKRRCGRDVSQ